MSTSSTCSDSTKSHPYIGQHLTLREFILTRDSALFRAQFRASSARVEGTPAEEEVVGLWLPWRDLWPLGAPGGGEKSLEQKMPRRRSGASSSSLVEKITVPILAHQCFPYQLESFWSS